MNLRRTTAAGAMMVAATVAALALADDKPAAQSPAPDMPADWFFADGAYVTPEQRAMIGKPAPKLDVAKWFQGEVTADSMKGKVVLLDFWATWCAPCKAYMPHTDELASKLKDKGFIATAICSDGEESLVPPFIAEKKLKLPMAWDKDAATYKAFGGADTFPTYVVIDRKGNVRAIGLTPAGVDKAVEKLLAEK